MSILKFMVPFEMYCPFKNKNVLKNLVSFDYFLPLEKL